MRSALGKECRKLFRKLMAVEFPEYREDKGQIVPPGCYSYLNDSIGSRLAAFQAG